MQFMLTSSASDLDAARYFLWNSTLVIGVTAFLFFVFGLCLGYLLWAAYKRRFHKRGEMIEVLKSENAMLKRRVAEPANRYVPAASAKAYALQTIARAERAAAATVPEVSTSGVAHVESKAPQVAEMKAAAPAEAKTPAVSEAKAAEVPVESKTDPALAEKPPTVSVTASPAPAAKDAPAAPVLPFSVVTSTAAVVPIAETIKPLVIEAKSPAPLVVTAIPIEARSPAPEVVTPVVIQAAPVIPAIALHARSAAFTMWTEAGWSPPVIKPLTHASKAFTLWTETDWVPAVNPVQVLPGSAAFSLWTDSSFVPLCVAVLYPSKAFTVWTAEDWTPTSHAAQALPQSAAFSVWTEEGYVPRWVNAFVPGQGFSVWTEAAELVSLGGLSALPSKAFTIWTQTDAANREPTALESIVAAATKLVHAVAHDHAKPPTAALSAAPEVEASAESLVTRAFAAARLAFGMGGRKASRPAPKVVAKMESLVSIAATPAAPAPVVQSRARDIFPVSKAFTIWTEFHPPAPFESRFVKSAPLATEVRQSEKVAELQEV